jgi:predicted Zn-dependent protease
VSGDLAEEITLGFSQGSTLLSQYPALIGTPEDQIAQSVFARLRATAAFQGVPNLPYRVVIIRRSDPNAFAQMGGPVYVTSGLAELMGADLGLWAAVMGHEIAHNIYRHGYKTYIREVELQRQIYYWRARVAMGDQSANWGLLAAVTAGKLINKKLERNDENDADKLGLQMMVDAGYHPDFARHELENSRNSQLCSRIIQDSSRAKNTFESSIRKRSRGFGRCGRTRQHHQVARRRSSHL